jgi:hypothetical protein
VILVNGGGGVGGRQGPKSGHSLRGLFQKVSQMDKLSRNGNIPGPNRLDQESVHNAKMASERIEKRLIVKKSLSVIVENRDVVYLGWPIASTYFTRKRQIAEGAISLCSRSPYCRLNMELDLQSLFGLHVRSSLAETPQPPPPPSPRIWAHRRGRYWSAKMDNISV